MARGELVPDEYMIPVGAKATTETKQCADSWTDSQIEAMRSRLPIEYHAVPLDWLRSRWIDIRKRGTGGYRVNGQGPRKGSRKKKIPVTCPKCDHFFEVSRSGEAQERLF